MDALATYLDQTADAFAAFRAKPAHRATIEAMAAAITAAFRAGGKLLLCGNGGSAGDAQHIAGEIVGRLMYDRPPLPAIALTTDTSVLTAIANDYGYDHVFERQVLGLGAQGDVLLAISTSGNSPGILRALEAARARHIACLGFTGPGGGAMAPLCDHILRAPGASTPIVQQIHITAGHAICLLVEQAMFPRADLDTFRASTQDGAPPAGADLAVQGLWWAAKGDWNAAHRCVQQNEGDPACDLVHAHLHRWEGDLDNARYWYHRAARPVPTTTLPEEWTAIATELLARA